MLTITLTPTMITFKDIEDSAAADIPGEFEVKWSEKGYYYVKGTPEQLYRLLLHLSYKYDVELT